MSLEVRPFTLAVEDIQIDDLRLRLDLTRWPDEAPVEDWSQGVPLNELRALLDYWRADYDWRRCERRLNAFGQFVTQIEGLDIHFLHVRSPHANALPLLITHGWPGSIVEFLEVIGPLTDPVAFGGKTDDAFHVIAPTLPGFGFSEKPRRVGWNVECVARAWTALMDRLGYGRWVAQGGDWGAAVTARIGATAPAGCIGIHLNMPIATPPPSAVSTPTADDKAAFDRMRRFEMSEGGYLRLQSTRPQTLGYGLTDSPAGLAAWIYEKLHAWSDHDGDVQALLGRDAILDNIMLYWLPAAAASSARLYWESAVSAGPMRTTMPVGVSVFPREIYNVPRSWMELGVSKIVYWATTPKGGHFAAWEQPNLFAAELRKCFALMR